MASQSLSVCVSSLTLAFLFIPELELCKKCAILLLPCLLHPTSLGVIMKTMEPATMVSPAHTVHLVLSMFICAESVLDGILK